VRLLWELVLSRDVLGLQHVEQVESYKYLGFVVRATKKLTFGTDALVATAKKALFAIRRRCALLGI